MIFGSADIGAVCHGNRGRQVGLTSVSYLGGYRDAMVPFHSRRSAHSVHDGRTIPVVASASASCRMQEAAAGREFYGGPGLRCRTGSFLVFPLTLPTAALIFLGQSQGIPFARPVNNWRIEVQPGLTCSSYVRLHARLGPVQSRRIAETPSPRRCSIFPVQDLSVGERRQGRNRIPGHP